MRDKILHKAILMLIKPAFTIPYNKNRHNTLNAVRKNGTKTTWLIKLNLVSIFKKMYHPFLIKKIKSKIEDKQLINLISQILKTGYINSQENILSPLFMDIMFNRMDNWIKIHLLTKYNTLEKNEIK